MKSSNVCLKFLIILMTLTGSEIYSHTFNENEQGLPTQKVGDHSAFPHLTQEMKKRLFPYLIQKNHPMKSKLDLLFTKRRITKNKSEFLKAGFKILDQRPRSYVVVARHESLKSHLIKCYFDTEYREKWDRPSWKWLANRCEGAAKIKKIINEFEIKHFDVANKWIYILPLLDGMQVSKESYLRHPALLLVTDMKLVPEKENLHAWKRLITKEILRELYVIITLANGSSYRADNIAYSESGKFCFIDCEYPSQKPNYQKIVPFLSSEMKAYWNSLVKAGNVALIKRRNGAN